MFEDVAEEEDTWDEDHAMDMVLNDMVKQVEEPLVEPSVVDPDDIGDAPPIEEEEAEPELFDKVDEVIVDEPDPHIVDEEEDEIDVFEDIEEVIKEEAGKLIEEEEVEEPKDVTHILNKDVRLKQNRINKLKNKVLERVQQRKEEILKQNQQKKDDVVLEEPKPEEKKVTKLVYRNKQKQVENKGEDRGFSVNIPKPPRRLGGTSQITRIK